MKVGICDDNDSARFTVSNWLKTRPEVMDRNIFEFRCGEALLEHLRRFTLDIVFLDCKMDGMDGIETARHIRKRDNRLVIILLTDYTDYALYGYKADIMDYILKKDFKLHVDKVFSKAARRIRENNLKTYAVRTGSSLFHLEIAEILYIESHARKKEIIMRDGGVYEFYGRIEDLENDLKKHGFIRPHGSFLVNSSYIKLFMPKSLWLYGMEAPLPVSQRMYRQAFNDMTVYATEVRL